MNMKKLVIWLLCSACAGMVSAKDITLQEALGLALKQNLGLQVENRTVELGRFSLEGSKGIFDPVLGADLSASSSKSPSSWQLQGADISVNKRRAFDLSLAQYLPTGGKFDVSWTNSRSETNSTFYFLNPSYNTGATASFSQPLLAGFGTDLTRKPVLQARYAYNQSLTDLKLSIQTTLLSVEDAYWDLYFYTRDLEVKQKDLDLANEFLHITERKIEVGTEAPINIYNAQVGVAIREQAIIAARHQLDSSMDILRQLMHLDPVEWQEPLTPADSPIMDVPLLEEAAALELAGANRPEFVKLAWQRERLDLDRLAARNALLPALDFSLSYGYGGLGGTYIVRDNNGNIVDILPGGWSDAFDQVKDLDYPSWQAALVFSYPLGNHAARANARSAEVNLELLDLQVAQLKESVLTEVRQAIRSVDNARKGMEAARVSRVLAEKNMDAERKRYDNGLSTNYNLLLVEKDLSSARSGEIQAEAAFRKAVAAYHFTTGKLLEFEGVQVEIPPMDEGSAGGWKFLQYGNYVD
jgi:outer membrane protein TolC